MVSQLVKWCVAAVLAGGVLCGVGTALAAGLLLALAANFNRQSSHHALVIEVMDIQRLLAMLVNNQSREIESLKREITDQRNFSAP